MKRYGNPYWQEATDNRDKTVAVMREDTFQQIQQALDKSGLNYCAYSDGSNTMIAVNSSEIDHFKNVTGLDESFADCRNRAKNIFRRIKILSAIRTTNIFLRNPISARTEKSFSKWRNWQIK